MKISVVIVTFNRLELLKECLGNVFNQSKQFNEIIVVNNASTDGTEVYLETIKDELTVIDLEDNLGGSGGFYYGLKKSVENENDWTLLIDDDAMISTNYNEIISKCISNEKIAENVSGFSGTVVCNGNVDFGHRSYAKSNKSFTVSHSTQADYIQNYFDYDFTTFCGVYISSKAVKKIGYPIKEYFIWHDDSEYSIRLRTQGIIRNINEAKLNHKTLINSSQVKVSWKNYYGMRNSIDIRKKYYGVFDNLKTILKIRMAIVYRTVFKNKNKQDKYIIQLYKDALRDGRKNNLGKNPNYLP